MDEILRKANELGLMIKGSELYKRLEDLTVKLDSDENSKSLLEEYVALSNTIAEKEESGAPIEVDEKSALSALTDRVSDNELLKEFIATQTYYMNLIYLVQKTINNPAGEPIAESKIIKPGGSGKIITDY
jgi:cell fate (sporulation/competence/biofilm development) regulator YlbF (YheA/YmcA/DUF963 family)